MNFESLEKEFKNKICDEISLSQEGLNRFIVFNPFMFDDGDHLVVLLKSKEDNKNRISRYLSEIIEENK